MKLTLPFLGAAVIIVDQLTKLIATLISTPVLNRGGSGWPFSLLLSCIGLISAVIGIWLVGDSYQKKIALTAIISAGISNVVDKLIHNGVVDIFTIGSWEFNIADIIILAGVVALLRPSKPVQMAMAIPD